MNSEKRLNIINVSFGTYPIPNTMSGGGFFLCNLSEELSKIPGCTAGIIDIKSDIHKDIRAGYRFYEVPNIKLKSGGLAAHALNAVIYAVFASIKALLIDIKNKIDILHLHNQFAAAFSYILKILFFRKYRIVYTVHSVALGAKGFFFAIRSPLEKFVLKAADHLVAITPTVKKWLIERHSIPESRITQIYLGTETGKIEEFAKNHPRQNRYNSQRVIIYVSRIAVRKNQLSLVKAMKGITDRFPDAKCVFVGPVEDDKYLGSIIKYINDNGLDNSVIFAGEVERAELYQLYANSDISVITSKLETQGLMLIESMAFGLPVITSDIGPFKDIININPGAALLVGPDDPVKIAGAAIKLFSDPGLCDKMRSEGRKLVSEFSWDRIAGKTYDMYKKLVES